MPTSTAQRDQALSSDLAALPEQIRGEVTEWCREWQEARALLRPSPREGNLKSWRVGKRIAAALDALDDDARVTPILDGIARAFQCARGQIYKLTDVARAFPDSLPLQRWEVLYRLAKMEPDQRDRLLRELEPNADLRDVPYTRRERDLCPEGKADKAESDRRTALWRSIEADFAALPEEERWFLSSKLLQSLDPAALEGIFDPDEFVSDLEQVVLRLRRSLPESAATAGESQAGDNGEPSG